MPAVPTPVSESAPSPDSEYDARRSARAGAVTALDRRHNRLASTRLILVVAAAGLAWMSFAQGWVSPWWLVAPALLFAIAAVIHDRVLTALDRARRAVAFYEQGQARLEDRWMGQGPTGIAYLQHEHPYAADLDLFGDGSLFQLMCAARLQTGEATLASWLLGASPAEVIRARHEAVCELRPQVDLREQLSLTGDEVAGFLHTEGLAFWGMQAPVLEGAWPRVVAALLAAANVGTLAAGFWLDLPVGWFALSVAVSVSFAARWRVRVGHVLASVNAPARDLRLLSEVLSLLESTRLSAPPLAALHARLAATGDTASHRIAQLTRIVDLLESRKNQVFAPLALALLWGTQMAFAVEAWRRRSGQSLSEWIAVAGEFEALMSLAGYAYEHPNDPNPQLLPDGPVFEAEGLAHPLLPRRRVVPNDVRLDGDTRVLVVSGSNMSGKSTLLRTVGVNVVLALSGAPVRAERLALSPLALGATLRIQDSLQEGRSRFFAEITRLKEIVDLSRGPTPVLFLLDELLSGTNSHDRRIGAAGIIRGLIDRGAIGLVTTHDLALAEVVSDLGVHAANVHFSDVFENGEMRFDYRMRPGIVRTSNAIALMRSIGLEIE
jgi:MutS domain V